MGSGTEPTIHAIMNHSRAMGLNFRGVAYTEIWNTITRGLDVVINLGRKHKLQVPVKREQCLRFQFNFLLGIYSQEKRAGPP